VADRAAIEEIFRTNSGNLQPIEWVNLESRESLTKAVDRRGGVDLVLGAPSWEFRQLAGSERLLPLDPADPVPWLSIRRPDSAVGHSRKTTDPRDDPNFFGLARASLQTEGWPKGYESLVRRLALSFPEPSPSETHPNDFLEGVGLIRGGRNLDRSRELMRILVKRGIATRATPDAPVEAIADGLLADLLISALVDASRELRDAGCALVRYNHPARAEASIGERPPWPPASVAKLRELPNGEALVETLLEQVAPDQEARDWLKASWSRPRRPIDGALLLEIAGAAEGRLANEPRFRAWLRGEWTAWTRQLYRRVARLAGGYVPS
jgi:hypothetical protein